MYVYIYVLHARKMSNLNILCMNFVNILFQVETKNWFLRCRMKKWTNKKELSFISTERETQCEWAIDRDEKNKL